MMLRDKRWNLKKKSKEAAGAPVTGARARLWREGSNRRYDNVQAEKNTELARLQQGGI